MQVGDLQTHPPTTSSLKNKTNKQKSSRKLCFLQNLDQARFYDSIRAFEETTLMIEENDHLLCEALCDYPLPLDGLAWVGCPSSVFPQYFTHKRTIPLLILDRYHMLWTFPLDHELHEGKDCLWFPSSFPSCFPPPSPHLTSTISTVLGIQ